MADQATNKQMETANQLFRRHDGILKTGEALSQGIHRRTLYAMRDEGVLERLDFPSIHIYWFSGEAFTAGVETRSIDRTTIHVYSVEKTLADCFKYRNKIGRTSRHACEQAPFEEGPSLCIDSRSSY